MPRSHPGMTSPAPSVKVKGRPPSHGASNRSPVENETRRLVALPRLRPGVESLDTGPRPRAGPLPRTPPADGRRRAGAPSHLVATSGKPPFNDRVKGRGCARRATRRASERSAARRESTRWAPNPDLAAELHPTGTATSTLYQLGASSPREVWWRCAVCGPRVDSGSEGPRDGSRCPRCASPRRTPRENRPYR
jgi:DNA-directed RNA polymerase subunit RPC12/RpoP